MSYRRMLREVLCGSKWWVVSIQGALRTYDQFLSKESQRMVISMSTQVVVSTSAQPLSLLSLPLSILINSLPITTSYQSAHLCCVLHCKVYFITTLCCISTSISFTTNSIDFSPSILTLGSHHTHRIYDKYYQTIKRKIKEKSSNNYM